MCYANLLDPISGYSQIGKTCTAIMKHLGLFIPVLYCVGVWCVWILLVMAPRGGGMEAFSPLKLEALPSLIWPPHLSFPVRRKNGKSQPFSANFLIFAPSKTYFSPSMPPQKNSSAAPGYCTLPYTTLWCLQKIIFNWKCDGLRWIKQHKNE